MKKLPGVFAVIYEFSATQHVRDSVMQFASTEMTLDGSQYWIAFGLGIILGMVELMARYRDEPLSLFGSVYTWTYMLFNGLLASLSLFLIIKLNLDFTPEGATSTDSQIIYNIMMAGFGGAAFFRSSVMQTRSGDKDVSVGPGLVIDIALSILDRAVDRYRAEQRSNRISQIIKGYSVRQVGQIITPYCIALMQNLSASERSDIEAKAAAALEAEDDMLASDESSDVKAAVLALQIANLVGFDVLDKAIEHLTDIGALSLSGQRPGASLGEEFEGIDGGTF